MDRSEKDEMRHKLEKVREAINSSLEDLKVLRGVVLFSCVIALVVLLFYQLFYTGIIGLTPEKIYIPIGLAVLAINFLVVGSSIAKYNQQKRLLEFTKGQLKEAENLAIEQGLYSNI